MVWAFLGAVSPDPNAARMAAQIVPVPKTFPTGRLNRLEIELGDQFRRKRAEPSGNLARRGQDLPRGEYVRCGQGLLRNMDQTKGSVRPSGGERRLGKGPVDLFSRERAEPRGCKAPSPRGEVRALPGDAGLGYPNYTDLADLLKWTKKSSRFLTSLKTAHVWAS